MRKSPPEHSFMVTAFVKNNSTTTIVVRSVTELNVWTPSEYYVEEDCIKLAPGESHKFKVSDSATVHEDSNAIMYEIIIPSKNQCKLDNVLVEAGVCTARSEAGWVCKF